MTRRIYANLNKKPGSREAAIREGVSLLRQLIAIVNGGNYPPVLDEASMAPLDSSMALLQWAHTVNAATAAPVEVCTGSHRTMTWLTHRWETADGKWATFNVNVYWDRPHEPILVDAEGDSEALAMLTLDTLWEAADRGYHRSGNPTTLDVAIAAAADHD